MEKSLATKDSVRSFVILRVAPGRAFELFVERFKDWWPQDYTFAQSQLATIAIEPGEGGRCFERDTSGEETVWGKVVAWEPPSKLAFSWMISPRSTLETDEARASFIEVSFRLAGDGRTRVDLTHKDFANHGEGWEAYASQMKSDYGWPLCLAKFEALAKAELR